MIRANQAKERASREFSTLSPDQLNWKPAPDNWSIGQCLDHLVVTDLQYFPVLRKIAEDNYEMSFWERWNPFNRLFGKMLLHQMLETTKKKVKTAVIFQPSASSIDAGIMERYAKHLDTLIGFIVDCRNTDLDKTHISSPVSKTITYSLRLAISILVEHLHRHLGQAQRVKSHKGFPGA